MRSAGRGRHLVTVNNYLARRDSQWMGHLYQYLGLTVGCLDDTEPSSPNGARPTDATSRTARTTSSGSTTCATTWCSPWSNGAARLTYAIIDEVDSILIDEARTPLIISGPVGNESDQKYAEYNAHVQRLVRKQTAVANRAIAEAEKILEEDPASYDGAVKLFQAQTRRAEEQAVDEDATGNRDQTACSACRVGSRRRSEAAGESTTTPDARG